MRSEKIVSLLDEKIAGTKLTGKQELLIEFLQKHGSMSFGDLIKKANTSSAVVNNLQLKGIIKFTTSEVIRRASLQSAISRRRKDHSQW